jgi:hypothetical protein
MPAPMMSTAMAAPEGCRVETLTAPRVPGETARQDTSWRRRMFDTKVAIVVLDGLPKGLKLHR